VIRPGIFARTFARPSLEEALDAVLETGLRATQFNLALAGGESLPDEIPAELARRVRVACQARGIEMAAVSGSYNMAHPDPADRARGGRALAQLIGSSHALGTGIVTLCTGTRDPGDMWRWHAGNDSREAWNDMLDSMQAALRVAELHGVTLAFEPERHNIVNSARAGYSLLRALPSPALKVVLDPVNLLQPGTLQDQKATMEDAFAKLGDRVVLAHAKDLRDDGAVVPAGRGGLDYDLYLRLLQQVGYQGPLILHSLSEKEVPASVAFLHRMIRSAGLETPAL
jgi:sugar phosphate isomerase/epimerase